MLCTVELSVHSKREMLFTVKGVLLFTVKGGVAHSKRRVYVSNRKMGVLFVIEKGVSYENGGILENECIVCYRIKVSHRKMGVLCVIEIGVSQENGCILSVIE